jgi:hypothetical protein
MRESWHLWGGDGAVVAGGPPDFVLEYIYRM